MTDDIKLPPLPRLQVPRIEADVTLIDIKVLAEWCERIATDYARAAVLAEREALLAENEKLRKVLKDADNELDWLDETVDTCDHSVGGCMCDYWNVRRKMKAALSKRNDNEQ